MSTELKPCPFCGSNDLHRTSNGHENHSVFCNVCGAEGPSAVSSTEAGEAWNQRALSAQPPADLWQYRWTNPGDQASLYPDDMAWKEVKPSNPHMQTLEQRIEELRAFRYNGKPTYEVRPLYAGSQPPAPSVPPVRERLTETQIDSASPLRIESAHWFKLGARWAERALSGGEG